MGLDARIRRSARLLYWMAGIAAVHVLTGGSIGGFVGGFFPFTKIFGSGIVDVSTGLFASSAPILGYLVAFWAIGTLVTLGVVMQHRVRWAPFAAMAFVALDAAVYFAVAAYAASGGGWIGDGLPAAMLAVVHGIVFWWLALAAQAALQHKTNERIVERLEFEAKLRRKLEETDAPPPPAATFTRYRQTPRT